MKIITYLALVLILTSGCTYLTSDEDKERGVTYDYVCASKANEFADQSEKIVQKMKDVGCEGVVIESVYAVCKELEADNKAIIREWKSLPCIDPNRAPTT